MSILANFKRAGVYRHCVAAINRVGVDFAPTVVASAVLDRAILLPPPAAAAERKKPGSECALPASDFQMHNTSNSTTPKAIIHTTKATAS
jgi:hypothetical protein